MSSSLRRLYEDLRSICVAVVYPPGEDRDVVTVAKGATVVWTDFRAQKSVPLPDDIRALLS